MEQVTRYSSHSKDARIYLRLTSSSLLLPSLLFVLMLLLLPSQQASMPSQNRVIQNQSPTDVTDANRRNSHARKSAESIRARRQSRPREGLLQTYWRLASEASNDTMSAIAQIRELFSTLIEPSSSRTNENIQSVDNSTAVVGEETDEGGNSTTTTTEQPPRKITTGELMNIFRRNVFGLGRLLGREFGNAIQQSNKNVDMYATQWTEALRPYLE